jgi:hypothetical protein
LHIFPGVQRLQFVGPPQSMSDSSSFCFPSWHDPAIAEDELVIELPVVISGQPPPLPFVHRSAPA